MENINVEYDNLRETGNNIINYSDLFRKEVLKIESNIEKLSYIWQGKDANKYIKKIQETYIPKFHKISDILNEGGKYIVNVEKGYELLDSTYASKKIDN